MAKPIIRFKPDEIDSATESVCGARKKTGNTELTHALLEASVGTRRLKKIVGMQVSDCLAQDDIEQLRRRFDALVVTAMAIGYTVGRNRLIQ